MCTYEGKLHKGDMIVELANIEVWPFGHSKKTPLPQELITILFQTLVSTEHDPFLSISQVQNSLLQ